MPAFAPAEPFAATCHKHRWKILFVCLALCICAFVTFGRSGGYGFIEMDDEQEVYGNAYVKDGFVKGSVAWALGKRQLYYWEPLTAFSHMLDCQMFGLNAGAHHLVSVGFHAVNASLLFLALLYMTGSLGRSALASALFALHPLRVESVVWIAERRDVLVGLFSILTLWLYAWYAKRPSVKRYASVWMVFGLALMSKPIAVVVPALLLLLDFWPLGRLRRETAPRLLLEKAPLFASAAVISVMTIQSNTGYSISTAGLTLPQRIVSAIVDCTTYLGMFLWPRSLAVLYHHVDPPALSLAAASLALLLLSWAALRQARGSPWVIAGWLWFLVALSPVIGIAQLADRFTYLPLIGPGVAVAWLAGNWIESRPRSRPLASLAAVLLLAGLGVLSWRQTGYWKDGLTLFRHSLGQTEDDWRLFYRYGAALANAGQLDEAVRNYREAIRLRPHYSICHASLGGVLGRQGKVAEAVTEYRQALAIEPANVGTLKSLSLDLIQTGSYAEAVSHLRIASRIAPNDSSIKELLGVATLLNKGAVQPSH